MSYVILAHTADIRLQVTGKNLTEIFIAALNGMNEIICGRPISDSNPGSTEPINISASDSTALLIDFLNEILSRTQINKKIYQISKFVNLTEANLQAEIYTTPTAVIKEDLKAVTYHEAELKKNAAGLLETNIVFDI